MEFTGLKEKNWSLIVERRRTGVYRMKGEELEFTYIALVGNMNIHCSCW